MNRSLLSWSLAITVVIASTVTVSSAPPEGRPAPGAASQSVDNGVYVDANRILMFVTNHGNFGRDLDGVFGNGHGTYFPFTTVADIVSGANKSAVLYAGGLWLGGVDSASGDTLITASEYTSECVPGPMVDGKYQTDRPDFRVYKLYRDSLTSNPNQDYLDWPVDQGAPVDSAGNPQLSGDQMAWTVYNDANRWRHHNANGSTLPIGVEIQQSVYAYDEYWGAKGNAVFLRFRLINKGSRTLKDSHVAFWLDPEIGSAGNDLAACDTSAGLFYFYNATNYEPDFVYPPVVPAFGVRIAEGPIVPSPGDTAKVDGKPRPGFRNLKPYAFSVYSNGADAVNYTEAYWYMHGVDAKFHGWPVFNPSTGDTATFMYSGDPVDDEGWIDPTPGDKRAVLTLRPFVFRPGDTQQVVLALVVGQGGNYLSSIIALEYLVHMLFTPYVTDVGGATNGELPDAFSLRQNYPNPFNPSTTISYSLPERTEVEVEIFNVLGQKIATPLSGSQSAGDHTLVWNGTDASGRPVASGIYFYRVKAGNNVQTRKMMLLK